MAAYWLDPSLLLHHVPGLDLANRKIFTAGLYSLAHGVGVGD